MDIALQCVICQVRQEELHILVLELQNVMDQIWWIYPFILEFFNQKTLFVRTRIELQPNMESENKDSDSSPMCWQDISNTNLYIQVTFIYCEFLTPRAFQKITYVGSMGPVAAFLYLCLCNFV